MNKRYQVFVSSTIEDLKEERLKVLNALLKISCIPAGMEYFSALIILVYLVQASCNIRTSVPVLFGR